MKVRAYKTRRHILDNLLQLKEATIPGHSADGASIRIKYIPFKEPTKRAIEEARPALRAGLDLQTFSGRIDKIWYSQQGYLILTMLVLERIVNGAYTYRSFNLDKGELKELIILE